MENIFIGTSGWSYKDWLGNFYPANLPINEYLDYYSRYFSTVEIDSTFYGIPRKNTVENWYKIVPPNFKFAPKLPQDITHKSNLSGVEDTLSAFLTTLSLLKEKLGPILMQFPYSFGPEMYDNLASFIKLLPSGFDFVIEIRNKKWLQERFYDLLRNHSIGLALIEHPWMPKFEVMTSKILYIRFLGDRENIKGDFSHEQIDRQQNLEMWRRMIQALEEKVDDFYGYFNNHYSGHSPTTARKFLELLEKAHIKTT
jgi:uncharacterized protein YecE (DUF72 family)